MARPKSVITLWGQYLAARLGVEFVNCFDCQTAQAAAHSISHVWYCVDRKHRERALQNIEWAMPHLSQAQARELARHSLEHFAKLLIEVCQSPRLVNPDNWVRSVEIGDLSAPLRLLNTGKPLIVLTGHVGNWELTGLIISMLGYQLEALARPLDNPLVNDWLLRTRQRHGLRILVKFDAADRMVEILDHGGSLGFIADQNAGDRGMFVPFFGKLASTYKSIGLLAVTQNVPILCGYAKRLGHGFRYRLECLDVIQPQDWANQPDPLYYVTARYIRAIEQMVRDSPEQYLWMHRRWKSRPRYEREGKPMPATVRRNLEALPWMDQPTLDRLMTV